MPAETTDDRAPLTATELQRTLAAGPTAARAGELAARPPAQFGQALGDGTAMLVDDLTIGWAIEATADEPPAVIAEVGPVFRRRLSRLGDTRVYAGAVTVPDGTAMRWVHEVDGAHVGGGQVEVFHPHPDS